MSTMRVALLDDYQDVALRHGDWRRVKIGAVAGTTGRSSAATVINANATARSSCRPAV